MVMAMQLKRLFKHLIPNHFSLKRAFPQFVLDELAQAIQRSEQSHRGELRFVIEENLSGSALLGNTSARDRAIELFSQLRIWDTEENSGVLLYVLWADRAIEIIIDRGLSSKINEETLQSICTSVELYYRKAQFSEGSLYAIKAIDELLAIHFPANNTDNEMPDQPFILT